MNDNYRRQQQQLCSMAANNNLVLQRDNNVAERDGLVLRKQQAARQQRQQIQLEQELAGCHLSGLPAPQIQQQQQQPSQRDNLQAIQFNQNQRSREPQQQQSMGEFANDERPRISRHLKQQPSAAATSRHQQLEQRNGKPSRVDDNSSQPAPQSTSSSLRSMFSSLLGGRHGQSSKASKSAENKANSKHQNGHRHAEASSASVHFNSADQFNSDQYASQLRTRLTEAKNFSPASKRSPIGQMSRQHQEAPSSADSQQNTCDSSHKDPNEHQQQHSKSALHVNFNRPNRHAASSNGGHNGDKTNDDDDESGDSSRKKKYLTAKYGQQQMSLIKKRLKIEMWLCERLKELAKGSRSEAELAEIDIDLDQLLDLEDEKTRQSWLRETLEPFKDLSHERVDEFVRDVLEQSRLL